MCVRKIHSRCAHGVLLIGSNQVSCLMWKLCPIYCVPTHDRFIAKEVCILGTLPLHCLLMDTDSQLLQPTFMCACTIHILCKFCAYSVHTLYIYCAYTVYILYIYCEYTVYILYIYCEYTVYILYIYCEYTVHTLHIYCAYTVHILCIYCTYTVHILCINCAYSVYILYICCTYTVNILYIYCTYTVHTLCTYCTYILHILYTYCTYTVHILTQNYLSIPHLVISAPTTLILAHTLLYSQSLAPSPQSTTKTLASTCSKQQHFTIF
jgi:hypothetical protein